MLAQPGLLLARVCNGVLERAPRFGWSLVECHAESPIRLQQVRDRRRPVTATYSADRQTVRHRPTLHQRINLRIARALQLLQRTPDGPEVLQRIFTFGPS